MLVYFFLATAWILCGYLAIGWVQAGQLNIIKHSIAAGLYTYEEARKFALESPRSRAAEVAFGPASAISAFMVYRRRKDNEDILANIDNPFYWVHDLTPELFEKLKRADS